MMNTIFKDARLNAAANTINAAERMSSTAAYVAASALMDIKASRCYVIDGYKDFESVCKVFRDAFGSKRISKLLVVGECYSPDKNGRTKYADKLGRDISFTAALEVAYALDRNAEAIDGFILATPTIGSMTVKGALAAVKRYLGIDEAAEDTAADDTAVKAAEDTAADDTAVKAAAEAAAVKAADVKAIRAALHEIQDYFEAHAVYDYSAKVIKCAELMNKYLEA